MNDTSTPYDEYWRIVKALAFTEPYVFSSEKYAHTGAAQELARTIIAEKYLQGWKEYYEEKTLRMSNYSGD